MRAADIDQCDATGITCLISLVVSDVGELDDVLSGDEPRETCARDRPLPHLPAIDERGRDAPVRPSRKNSPS